MPDVNEKNNQSAQQAPPAVIQPVQSAPVERISVPPEKVISPQEKLIVPQRMFFTKGVGVHKEYLASFELALRDAGIAPYNIVHVSSIFPPRCKRMSRDDGVKILYEGQILFAVMARNATNEPNRLLAASIGVAQPSDENQYG